jgi:Iap family predicted aminopeptidase
MNKDDIKIKYIIGTYRDSVGFPTIEDFQYLMSNWYWNEGGHHFIHTYRGIPDVNRIVFPDNILREKLEKTEAETKTVIESLLESRKISVNKATKFTTYYEIVD